MRRAAKSTAIAPSENVATSPTIADVPGCSCWISSAARLIALRLCFMICVFMLWVQSAEKPPDPRERGPVAGRRSPQTIPFDCPSELPARKQLQKLRVHTAYLKHG